MSAIICARAGGEEGKEVGMVGGTVWIAGIDIGGDCYVSLLRTTLSFV